MLVALPLAGCSFVLSEAPPRDHAQLRYFDCSTSYAPPVIDTVFAGLQGTSALLAARTSAETWRNERGDASRSATIAGGLVAMGIWGASAIHGYRRVSACRPAREHLMLRMTPHRGPPPGWPPPPTTWPPLPPTWPPLPPPG